MFEIGKIRGILELEDRFTSTFEAVANNMTSIAGKLTSAGAAMTAIGGVITLGVTVPLVAMGTAAFKASADFDAAMTKSLAITEGVSAEMREQMELVARDVAKTTRFTADEAGAAYFDLISSGLTAAQAMEALPITAKFAQAGLMDLAAASEFLTDAQNALGLKSADATQNMLNMAHVSDVLTKANNISAGTIEDFARAINNKAGAALRMVNKDIEEGTAVLAAYASQGVKAQAAGDKLNIVLRDLQTQAIKHKDAFADYGISVFDASGNMNNMADIVGDLEKAFAGLSDEQRRAAIMTLGFQDRSVAALLQLVGFSEKIRENEAALRSAGGATEEVAKKQLQTFWEQLGLIQHRLHDLSLTIGKALAPVGTMVLEVANIVVRALELIVNGFAALPSSVRIGITAFLAFLAILGPLVTAVGGFLLTLGLAMPAFVYVQAGFMLVAGAITSFMSFLAPVGAVITALGENFIIFTSALTLGVAPILAIGAAIVAGIAIWRTWGDEIKSWVSSVYDYAVRAFQDLVKWLGTIADAIGNAVQAAGRWLLDLGTKVMELAQPFIDTGKSVLDFIGSLAKFAALSFIQGMLAGVKLGLELLGYAAKFVWDIFIGVTSFFLDQFKPALSLIGEVAVWLGKILWNAFVITMKAAYDTALLLAGGVKWLFDKMNEGLHMLPMFQKGMEDGGKATGLATLEAKNLGAAFVPLHASVQAVGTSMGQGATATQSLAQKYAEMQRILNGLSKETRDNIDAGLKMHLSVQKIEQATGVAAEVINLYKDSIKETTKELKEAVKVQKEWEESLSGSKLFAQGEGISKALQGRDISMLTKDEAKKVLAVFTDIIEKSNAMKIAVDKDVMALVIRLDGIVTHADDARTGFELLKNSVQWAPSQSDTDAWTKYWQAVQPPLFNQMDPMKFLQPLPGLGQAQGPDQQTTGHMDQFGKFIPDKTGLKAGMDLAGNIGRGLKDTLSKELGPTIIGALQGGGSVLQSVAGLVGGSITKSLAGSLTKSFPKFMSGFLGETLNSILPGIGALIGPLVGKLAEMFHKPAYKDIMGRVGHEWGVTINEQLAKGIADDAKNMFGGDRQAAEIWNIDKILPTINAGNFDMGIAKLRDAFVMFKQGKFSIQELSTVLDKNFSKFLEAGTDAAGRWSVKLQEIISLAREAGVESKAIADALKEQGGKGIEGFNKVIESFAATDFKNFSAVGDALKAAHKPIDDVKEKLTQAKKKYEELLAAPRTEENLKALMEMKGSIVDLNKELTKTEQEYNKASKSQMSAAAAAKQTLSDLGMQGVAVFAAAVASGKTFFEALGEAAPGLQSLKQAYTDLGLEVDNVALKSLFLSSSVLQDNPALVAGIDGLGQSMVALSNLGLLNAETFGAMERTGLAMYSRLQAATAAAAEKSGDMGDHTREALLPMQDWLHRAEEQAKLLGVPLDANVQLMIDQSQQLGIWKEIGPSAMDKMTTATETLAEVMQKVLDRLNGLPAAAAAAAGGVTAAFSGITTSVGGADDALHGFEYGHSPGGLIDLVSLAIGGQRAINAMTDDAIQRFGSGFDALREFQGLFGKFPEEFPVKMPESGGQNGTMPVPGPDRGGRIIDELPKFLGDISSKLPSMRMPETTPPGFWQRQPDWNHAMDSERREPEVIRITETHVLQPVMVDRRDDIGQDTIDRMWRDLPRDLRLDREGVRMTIQRIADGTDGQ